MNSSFHLKIKKETLSKKNQDLFHKMYDDYVYKELHRTPFFRSTRKQSKKLGVVLVTHGNNGTFVHQAIESFLNFLPCISTESLYFVVYVNESKDKITLNLQNQFPSIHVVYIENQKEHGGLTGAWNKGIDLCFANGCESIILSNDDIFILPNIEHLLEQLDTVTEDQLLYFGPVTNNPGCDNLCQYSLKAKSEDPKLTFNRKHQKKWNLNGFFMAFPKHVLLQNKFDSEHYFNPSFPFEKNETEWYNRFQLLGGDAVVVPRTFVYHYKLKSWRNTKEKQPHCLYTCVLGGYENSIYISNAKNMNYDVYFYTDCLSFVQECVLQDIKPMLVFHYDNPKLKQRHIKSNPMTYLPSFIKESIWIDGNILFLETTYDIYEKRSEEIVCYAHPNRNCIGTEIEKTLQLGLINKEMQYKMSKIYKKYNFDPYLHKVLTETCILYRKHNKTMKHFGEAWFKLIQTCPRDQLSFDFLTKYENVSVKQLPFQERPVIKLQHDNPHTRFQNGMKNS